jgi:DNA-directed RNA polymerase specialized sigma24 family protein
MDAQAQEEFGQFMAGRGPGLVRLAYGPTGDRWLAEDIAQTALATAYAAWWRVSRADDPDGAIRSDGGQAGPGEQRRKIR